MQSRRSADSVAKCSGDGDVGRGQQCARYRKKHRGRDPALDPRNTLRYGSPTPPEISQHPDRQQGLSRKPAELLRELQFHRFCGLDLVLPGKVLRERPALDGSSSGFHFSFHAHDGSPFSGEEYVDVYHTDFNSLGKHYFERSIQAEFLVPICTPRKAFVARAARRSARTLKTFGMPLHNQHKPQERTHDISRCRVGLFRGATAWPAGRKPCPNHLRGGTIEYQDHPRHSILDGGSARRLEGYEPF